MEEEDGRLAAGSLGVAHLADLKLNAGLALDLEVVTRDLRLNGARTEGRSKRRD